MGLCPHARSQARDKEFRAVSPEDGQAGPGRAVMSPEHALLGRQGQAATAHG